MKIEAILYFYGLVCIAMIAFNIFHVFISKQNVKFINASSDKYYKRIKSYIGQNISKYEVDKKTAKKIKRNLLKTVRLQSVDKILDQLTEQEWEKCKVFIKNNFHICQELVQDYLKKDSVKSAYFLHLLYKYDICSFRPDDTILDELKSYLYVSGIYCRHNAMMVLYKAGVPEKIIEALKILNKMDVSVHERILSVGLRQYSGEKDLLVKKFLKEFPSFQLWIQEAVCNFIIEVGGGYQKEVLEILENTIYTREIHCLCMKYLGLYPYEKAYQKLVDIVQDEKMAWQYKTYAIDALANYPSKETTDILKRMLHSSNWNIRSSAAKSLEKQKFTYYELSDIFNGNDRYAREIMQYFLEERKLKEV